MDIGEEDIETFKLPLRSQTDEHNIKYCVVTSDTSIDDVKKLLIGEFRAGQIMKATWGKETLNFDVGEKKIFDIINELRAKNGGNFNHKQTLVATFNFIGGAGALE